MTEESRQPGPDLNLTPPPGLAHASGPRSRGSGFVVVLLVIVVVLEAVVLLHVTHDPGSGGNGSRAADAGAAVAAPEALEAQALRLEELGVADKAAEAWERYLATGSGGTGAARALIRYRAGKLYQEAGRHSDALAALIRAEKEGLEDEATRKALGPRIIDCLRAMGHYGAVTSELHRRVGTGGDEDASPVVAAFAGETLSRARFDRILEKEIDASLEAYRDRMGPEALKAQRDRIVKMYRSPDQARAFLENVVMKEVMVRRARELKLDRDEAFRERMREVEGLLLAKKFQDREVTARLQPTESDIRGYYEIHKADYKTPEAAKLRVIQVQSVEEGLKLLPGLKDGKIFALAAEKSSLHEASKKAGGLVEAPLTKGRGWPGFGYSADLEKAVFDTATATTLEEPFELDGKVYLVRVEEKIPEAVRPLEAVQQQVVGDYLAQKKKELLEALRQELRDRYQVRFNPGGLKPEPAPKETGKEKP